MSNAQNILKKIVTNQKTMSELKKTQNFKEFYNFFKKIDMNITEPEIEEIKQELIGKNNLSSLTDEKINLISGEKMDFNKFKTTAVATLMATSMLPNTGYAVQSSTSSTTETVQTTKTRKQKGAQEILDKSLLQAVIAGDKALAEKLINQGSNINKSYQVKVDARYICDEVWSNNPNERSINRNALGLAALTGQIELVKLLLKNFGADINNNSGSGTTLRFAAENGHFQVVEYLLDNGAKDIHESALSSAIGYSKVDIVRLFLERGANANEKEFWTKYSLLMEAAYEGNAKIVKLLLAYGASVFVRDNEGKTALDYARTDEIRAILKEAEEKGLVLRENNYKRIQATQKRNTEELKKAIMRDKEIDTLIENLFEQKVLAHLSEERFLKMTERYEDE